MKEPIFIKEFLPEQIFGFIQNYIIIKYSNHVNFDSDIQANSLIGTYGDYVMETLLDLSLPVIEQNVGKKLFPTYSYFRIYDKGSDLPFHTDRESCEFTVALCLGAEPNNIPYEIFVGEKDENSDYKYINSATKKFERLKILHKYPMLPNNALIFDGREKPHWREECHHDYFSTVFLHYVDQEGPQAENKFDKRLSLGAKK